MPSIIVRMIDTLQKKLCGSACFTVTKHAASGTCSGAAVGAGAISGPLMMVARGACSTCVFCIQRNPWMCAGDLYASEKQALASAIAVLTGCATHLHPPGLPCGACARGRRACAARSAQSGCAVS